MTKKEEEQLVWRLKERPTAEGVARLVEQGIIKSDEARTLLFSTMEEKNNEEIKALKEQVKYFQGLVESLIAQRNTTTIVPYTHIVKTPFTYWKNLSGYSSSNLCYDYDAGNKTLTMSVSQ